MVAGGCSVDLCACKVFIRDRDYIPESKALTPRESRERLTRDGAAWLTEASRVGRWGPAVKEMGCSESAAARIGRAIEEAGPYVEGEKLARLKGELGRKAWLVLLAFLRERGFVFGAGKPCPLCGRD
jgi:hypothetical protein